MSDTPEQAGQRAAFEHWVHGLHNRDIARFPEHHLSTWPGQYLDVDVQLAWEAWEEALTKVTKVQKSVDVPIN